MNWTKTALTAAVGGVVMWLVSFVLHGFILGSTYMKYTDVFTQEAANPFAFLLIEILIAFPAAVVFAKTRGSWGAGIGGGLVFGFWLGLFGGFAQHFSPLVIEGFPYYLAWCWFGTNMIVSLALGAVLGAMIRPATA